VGETKIQLNQIVSPNIGEDLKTYLSNLNLKVGYFGGQVNSLEDLTSLVPFQDMQVFIKDENRYVRYNGGSWEDVTSSSLQLSDLQDIDIQNLLNKNVLLYNGQKWINKNLSISDVSNLQTELNTKAITNHQHVIANISDLQEELESKSSINHQHVIADISSLQEELESKSNINHQHVVADISDLSTILNLLPNQLNELSDVQISNLQVGQILKYNGLVWINANQPSGGGSGSSELSGLSDVLLSNLSSGQILLYNGIDWINSDIQVLISDISGLQEVLNNKASIDSPNFTGTPTSTNPPLVDNSTKIATTSFVKSQGYLTATDLGVEISVIDGGTF